MRPPINPLVELSLSLSTVYASGRFFYKPITLTALGVGFAILAYVAMTQDVLKEGQEKQRM